MVLPPVWTSAYVATFALREFRRDDPELTWMMGKLAADDVFVDVGANLGQWTLPVARHLGRSGRVIAIEAAATTAAALQRAVDINDLAHVQVISAAVSSDDGSARLHHHDRDPSQHSLGSTGLATEEVRLRALDSLLVELGVNEVDFVKLDVEGAEEMVLHGSAGVLSDMRPTLVFEACKGLPERLNLEPDGAWRLLLEAGYRTFRLSEDGSLHPAGPDGLDKQTHAWNVIAIPAERVPM